MLQGVMGGLINQPQGISVPPYDSVRCIYYIKVDNLPKVGGLIKVFVFQQVLGIVAILPGSWTGFHQNHWREGCCNLLLSCVGEW
eukprot:13293298-Ditylum_brightwellii.AAC.2